MVYGHTMASHMMNIRLRHGLTICQNNTLETDGLEWGSRLKVIWISIIHQEMLVEHSY